MTPTVSIVILTYNSARHLPALFESLHDQTYQSLEIIVVDNASSDGTVAWLNTQEILPIQFIQNSENVWFAKGNNQGIQQATGEFIYICNDDIVLTSTAIERLVQRMNQDSFFVQIGRAHVFTPITPTSPIPPSH